MKRLIVILNMLAGTLFINAAFAETLFDNGAATESSGFCMSGPDACGGFGSWTVFDDFTLSSLSLIEGLSFGMGHVSDESSYLSTNWSIWDQLPAIGGSALVSGNSVGSLTSIVEDQYQVSLDDLAFELAAGTYWVGFNSVGDENADSIFSYLVTGEQGNAFSSDLVESSLYKGKALAFQIDGTIVAVPEPANYAMFIVGIVGIFGYTFSRSNKQTYAKVAGS